MKDYLLFPSGGANLSRVVIIDDDRDAVSTLSALLEMEESI